jgi:hypothetical protein
MHLQRNFVWTLDLSDRELKVIIKCLEGGTGLDAAEVSLAKKLADAIPGMASRLERVSSGKRRRHTKSD